jgi:hypothetical protein
MGVFAVVVNAGLIAFTGTLLEGCSDTYRLVSFTCITLLLLGVKRTLEVLIPDVSDEARIQLARQQLYVDKIFHDKPDDYIAVHSTDEVESLNEERLLIRHDSGSFDKSRMSTYGATEL